MKAAKMNYFRNLLVIQMNALQNAVGKTISGMKTDTGKCADSLDMAAVEFDRQLELSMRGRERGIIQEIREALQRIDRGLFGVCDRCGEVISEKRLLARPTSCLCRDCQQRQETAQRAIKYLIPEEADASSPTGVGY
ncbi:MAG: TraR/DksA family transcriptional regulator [Syntrophales bacterium]|jgi:DnaK suppressor protein|nr:TraR/DksA family transcriptional regulator [Syntrophales bacterium]